MRHAHPVRLRPSRAISPKGHGGSRAAIFIERLQVMSFKPWTFKMLRKSALGKAHSSEDDSHYGDLVSLWLNEGHTIMVAKGSGVEACNTFTAEVGLREYDLPADFISEKLVLYNGLAILNRGMVEQDFFTTGVTSDIDRFSIWGRKLILGPLPPDQPYPVTLYYYRGASYLEEDDQEPDVPPQFRPYLASYAAAWVSLTDHDKATAETQMQHFNDGVHEYEVYLKYGSKQNYPTVVREWY